MAKYTTLIGNVTGRSNSVTMNLPVANSVTVTAGDFVYMTSGRISSATITGDVRIIGQVQSTATGNSTGTVKALVVVDPDAKYLAQQDNVGTTFAASHVGQYFDLTGATGVQLVDTSTVSATTGVLVCLEYNPPIAPVATDLTYGIFKIAEHAFFPLGA
jgi:hypothetical protein